MCTVSGVTESWEKIGGSGEGEYAGQHSAREDAHAIARYAVHRRPSVCRQRAATYRSCNPGSGSRQPST
jgi:hypothetical protein